MFRSRLLAVLASGALVLMSPWAPLPALAGGGYAGGAGKQCAPGNFTVNKSLTINKTINISKPVTITKNISIQKNIDLSKNISINKTITINKGGGGGSASAMAIASALAFASARATAVSYGGNYIEEVARGGGDSLGAVAAEQACVEQSATVMKAVHAVCVDRVGREHPATRMRPETWIDASYSGEIFRCIEGATLRAVIGHVVQSDAGTAAVYDGGEALSCRSGEALRHFAGGLVKCAVAERVPDCTERTNLRRYGAGDIFFSFQEKVCAPASASSERNQGSGLELSGMSLNGGVGN